MRYRRLGYRYAVVLAAGEPRMVGDPWRVERWGVVLAQPRWRPSADVFETGTSVRVIVELAGVDHEDDLDVLLFEDAIVIEGQRRVLPNEAGFYHAAEIRQGPFRLEVALPSEIDTERVDARYDRGLLTITVAKHSGEADHGD